MNCPKDFTDRTCSDESDSLSIAGSGDCYLAVDICPKEGCMIVEEWDTNKLNSKEEPKVHDGDILFQYGYSCVDSRTLPTASLGKGLAELHFCRNTPKVLNLMFRRWSRTKLTAVLKTHNLKLLCEDQFNDDRTAELAHDFGADKCVAIMKVLSEQFHDTTAAVEKRNDGPVKRKSIMGILAKRPQRFSWCPSNNVSAFDIARDVGLPLAYPIACAMAHAMSGRQEAVSAVFDSINQFWDAYAEKALEEGQRDECFMYDTFRNAMGWCGWFLYMSYKAAAYTSMLPRMDGPVADDCFEDEHTLMDSIGRVGLVLMNCTFGEYMSNKTADLESLQDLRNTINDFLEEELETLEDICEINGFGASRLMSAKLNHIPRKVPCNV